MKSYYTRIAWLFTVGLAGTAQAQIFIADGHSTVSYNLDGSPIAPVGSPLITGSTAQFNVLAVNNQLYVPQQGATPGSGSLGVYNRNGTPVNANLITGLYNSLSVAVSGGYIYAGDANNGTIGQYNLDGSVVNNSLIYGLSVPSGLTVVGGHIYVADQGLNSVGEYNLDGTAVNTALVTPDAGGVIDNIASDGSDLFVSDINNNTVGEYGLDGTPINTTLISGLNGPSGIALYKGHVYVENNYGGTLGEYQPDGTPVNPSLISGLDDPLGIDIVTPTPAPEPSVGMFAVPAAVGLLALGRRRMAKA